MNTETPTSPAVTPPDTLTGAADAPPEPQEEVTIITDAASDSSDETAEDDDEAEEAAASRAPHDLAAFQEAVRDIEAFASELTEHVALGSELAAHARSCLEDQHHVWDAASSHADRSATIESLRAQLRVIAAACLPYVPRVTSAAAAATGDVEQQQALCRVAIGLCVAESSRGDKSKGIRGLETLLTTGFETLVDKYAAHRRILIDQVDRVARGRPRLREQLMRAGASAIISAHARYLREQSNVDASLYMYSAILDAFAELPVVKAELELLKRICVDIARDLTISFQRSGLPEAECESAAWQCLWIVFEQSRQIRLKSFRSYYRITLTRALGKELKKERRRRYIPVVSRSIPRLQDEMLDLGAVHLVRGLDRFVKDVWHDDGKRRKLADVVLKVWIELVRSGELDDKKLLERVKKELPQETSDSIAQLRRHMRVNIKNAIEQACAAAGCPRAAEGLIALITSALVPRINTTTPELGPDVARALLEARAQLVALQGQTSAAWLLNLIIWLIDALGVAP